MRCCRKIIGIGFCVRHQSSTASKTVSQSPASAQRLNVISFRLLFNRLFAFAISRQQKGFSRASCSHAMEHETSAHGGRTKEPTKRSRKNILFCVCQGWNGCDAHRSRALSVNYHPVSFAGIIIMAFLASTRPPYRRRSFHNLRNRFQFKPVESAREWIHQLAHYDTRPGYT